MKALPVGKLPPALIERLARKYAPDDPRVILGPGIGLDCAVIQQGDQYLVAKTDPITFTAQRIGWYAVHVNANDVATTGARPRWFLVTALLPEAETEQSSVESLFDQIVSACREVGASFVGGHTEITSGLNRPILVGTMFGEVPRERLVTPTQARPGDGLLLTKGIPIEATSILAQDFRHRLKGLDPATLDRAAGYLDTPGISVVAEALAAADAGGVSAMHDPTEGGLAAGLWELAEASGVAIEVDASRIPVPPEAAAICEALGVNPLEAIASGALLISVRPEAEENVRRAIHSKGVAVQRIGTVRYGSGVTIRREGTSAPLPWPDTDALTRLFQSS